jgi:hypothetical protein
MVKCSECGYLAIRNRFIRLLDEAEQSYRDTGKVKDVPRRTPIHHDSLPGPWDRSEPLHEEVPICFENAFNLGSLAYTKAKAKDPKRTDESYRSNWFITEDDIHEMLAEERCCPSWTQWHQGFNPKEHRQMIDRQRLLEYQTKREDDWQKFQAQMAADDRKWREEQEAKAEERHQQEMQTIRNINRTQLWIMGGLVTLIIVIATIIGGAMEANWFPKWFGIGQVQTVQPVTQSVPDTQDVQPSEVP